MAYPRDNVVQFPRRLRAVAPEVAPPAPATPGDLVEHDGRTYRFAELLRGLTPGEQRAVDETAPRTAQVAWDAAVRRWPALTAAIVAGARAVE